MRASKGKVVNLRGVSRDEILRQMHCVRRTWNYFLGLNKNLYNKEGKFLFFKEMSILCTKIRSDDIFFSRAPRSAQTCALRALDRAIVGSLPSAKLRNEFPVFKKKGRLDSMTIQASQVGMVRENGFVTHIRWPYVGLLRVKGARLPDKARVGFVTLRETSDGFRVSFNYEVDEVDEVVIKREIEGLPLGIDLGLESLITLSTGEKIEPPKFYRKTEKKLRKAQKSQSRKSKGSVNYRRNKKAIRRIHARISRLRENHTHHLSKRLVERFSLIVIEDLALSGMSKTRLAKSIYDAGWSELRRQLSYKLRWSGGLLMFHPRFKRSTGVCQSCHAIMPSLDMDIRNWTCSFCNDFNDRDIAAAREIARSVLVGTASPEPVPRIRSRCKKRASAGMRQRVVFPLDDQARSATNMFVSNICLQQT